MPPPSDESALPAQLEAAFRATSTAAVMLHDTVAGRLGLNATDHKCMSLLCQHGPVSAGDLAAMTGLTTGAVTGVANRLEKAGYARRIPNPADARSVLIEPMNAEAFMEQVGGLLARLRVRMNDLVAQYSEDELGVILRFITESTRISRDEAVRLAESAALARRFP
jgi:DNA-binding MarR family transcriptional regulator